MSDEVEIVKDSPCFLLNYFAQMSHCFIDTYLVVLLALEDICEANHVINETKLVNELHMTILHMYNDNIIKELPSCLKQIIETALRRFHVMELVVIKHYTTSTGSTISFVSCPFKINPKIEALKAQLNELQKFTQ